MNKGNHVHSVTHIKVSTLFQRLELSIVKNEKGSLGIYGQLRNGGTIEGMNR
jgi:hypothetical protein